jgi:hypothetical protein
MKNNIYMILAMLLFAAPVWGQTCPGPTFAGTTRNYKFTTRAFSTAVPTTGAGLVVKAYKGNSTSTEITTGITTTFTSGFDAVAGLVNLAVDYSADGTFYASGSDISFILTAGTVDSTSVVGETICNVHLLPAPAVAEIPSVNATYIGGTAQTGSDIGAAMVDVLSASLIRGGTAQAGSARTITLDSGASSTNNIYSGAWIIIVSSTGVAQKRQIVGYVGSTKVATVDRVWVTNPTSSSVFAIIP